MCVCVCVRVCVCVCVCIREIEGGMEVRRERTHVQEEPGEVGRGLRADDQCYKQIWRYFTRCV